MNITSAQYVNDEEGTQLNMLKCVIDGINMSVPIDSRNRHYEEILKQVEAGNLTIAAAE